MSTTITTASLKTMKKQELKDLATRYKLNTKGLRSDLEDRLRVYLESQEEEEENSRPRRPARSFRKPPTPDNRVPRSTKTNLNGDRSDELSDELFDDDKKEDIQEEGSSSDITSISRRDSWNRRAVNENTESYRDIFKKLLMLDEINRFIIELRRCVTNSRAFVLTILALHILVFLVSAVEWIKYKTVPVPFLLKDGQPYHLQFFGPDVSIFSEWHRFWRPLLVFWAFLVILPCILAYIFNFEPYRHPISPLAFSVAQYCILSVSSGNLDWVEDVRQFIPETFIYTGAGASVIFSLYETVLTHSGGHI